jgi:hypothetical protein
MSQPSDADDELRQLMLDYLDAILAAGGREFLDGVRKWKAEQDQPRQAAAAVTPETVGKIARDHFKQGYKLATQHMAILINIALSKTPDTSSEDIVKRIREALDRIVDEEMHGQD